MGLTSAHAPFLPSRQSASRTPPGGRAIRRDGRSALRASPETPTEQQRDEARQGAKAELRITYSLIPLLPYSPQIPASQHSCLLPTWWFWRGGCTRSHSEHGRETPQRRWYFVSRRGRVGRCQVCQMHECKNLLDTKTRRIRRLKGPRKRPKSFQNNTNPGKCQRLR